ncbi:DNA polymerase delta subunit 4 [Cladorrhinum sp. PSN259]|nr:DNA polymerase delta subunit 4 [Cladorrhinum sp. PSN259]
MPVTRRSTRSSSGSSGGGGAAASGKQAKISFKSRVTKSIKDGEKKKPYKSPARAKEWKPVPEPEAEEESQSEIIKGEVEELTLDDLQDVKLTTTSSTKSEVKEDDDVTVQARKMTDAAINRYWKGIEDSRMAKEVHRKHGEGLEVGEKVLRYFDVSSQFGPCIGITRLKRWQRAQRLGLHPPIEVLAVLVKEDVKGNKGLEGAHMDELLSSTAIGSV